MFPHLNPKTAFVRLTVLPFRHLPSLGTEVVQLIPSESNFIINLNYNGL